MFVRTYAPHSIRCLSDLRLYANDMSDGDVSLFVDVFLGYI